MEQQSTSGSSLHSDLITEILLRLPAKSVGRFRCVSKLWLSITTDPCFIKSFGTTRPSLLLCSIQGHNMFVTHQSSRSCSYSQPLHPYPMKVPGKSCYFSHMDSVHGLICIVDVDSLRPLVWNPTMGQLLVLPKPKFSSRHMSVFLGYDPVEGIHKVVCFPQRKTCYVCLVFTLRSGQESWRTIKTNFEHSVAFASGRCIKGVIYYLAFKSHGYDDTVVMSFDLRSEIFHMIEVPASTCWDSLITYKGRLACIEANNDKRLWILEDADKHKWLFQDFLSPLHKDELKGSTHAGEFIYVPFNKSPYIELYNPVGNSWRRLKFEGLEFEGNPDAKFGQTKAAFTNHIESLMPL